MKDGAVLLMMMAMVFSAGSQADESPMAPVEKTEEMYPWCNCFCISFFTKTRSAKIVPEGTWLLSLKYEDFDADRKEKPGLQGDYGNLPSGSKWEKEKYVFCAKYGWAKNHQIAVGVPYLRNDFETGSLHNESEGIGNVFVFEKWQLWKETNTLPAVSVDFWYFFPTGDSDRKLGMDDEAYKVTTSISKAWKDFSLHLNPGYRWNRDEGNTEEGEVNAAILFTPTKSLWPAVEYNYFYKQGKGHSHDIVPGLIWKYRKGGAVKVGVPINVDSTFTYRDRVGLVLKLSQCF